MPYTIKRNGDQHCIYRQDTGAMMPNTCHANRADAQKQMVAMMLAEARQGRSMMSAEFAGTRPGPKPSGHKSPPAGYPQSRDAYADPENYKYPLETAAHARAALAYWNQAGNQDEYTPAERAYITARIMAACRRFGIDVAAAHSATFDAVDLEGEAWQDGELVYRAGKLFELGDYPDKEFALTEEEADAAIAAFEPCAVDMEHVPTVLDGKLGQVLAVEREGRDLLGVVALPAWLDGVLAEGERKVSCTWDRATKRLIGLALVRSPRVPDAALLSAFNGSSGAGDEPAPESRPPSGPVGQPAGTAGTGRKERHRMNLLERFKAFLAGIEEEAGEAGFGETPPAPDPPAEKAPPKADAVFAAELKALKDELAAQQRRSEEERVRRIEAEATAFSQELVREGKALPPETAAIVALFTQAAHDDDRQPADVTFGTDREGQPLKGTRVAALRAMFASRPRHMLMDEVTAGGIPEGAAVLLNRTQTEPKFSQEEIDQELARTPLGRAALAARKNGGR